MEATINSALSFGRTDAPQGARLVEALTLSIGVISAMRCDAMNEKCKALLHLPYAIELLPSCADPCCICLK
ncbi:hypothetical protein Trydic_g1544 [Trypoxylus dichotomus]